MSLKRLLLAVLMIVLVVGLSGCNYFNRSDEEMKPESQVVEENQPFYARDFNDILIPDGLRLDRKNSMHTRSQTFNGGILNYEGRLDVNSLLDFFENSMSKNGWQLAGTVKSDKSLLIFVKANKTCMITVADSKFNLNTEVYFYISETSRGMN